jgi:hypothetical protein
MPRISEKQACLKQLEYLILVSKLRDLSDQRNNNEDNGNRFTRLLILWYLKMQSDRYLDRSNVRLHPCYDMHGFMLNHMDAISFKQEVRMSKERFLTLVELIRHHQVFSPGNRRPMAPVELQLLVALKRFGSFGNGASIGNIARRFSISGDDDDDDTRFSIVWGFRNSYFIEL